MKTLAALAALCGLALAAADCPHDKEVECITDVNKGTSARIQPSTSATRPPIRRARTRRPTSPAWSTSRPWSRTAGRASARSPPTTTGRSRAATSPRATESVTQYKWTQIEVVGKYIYHEHRTFDIRSLFSNPALNIYLRNRYFSNIPKIPVVFAKPILDRNSPYRRVQNWVLEKVRWDLWEPLKNKEKCFFHFFLIFWNGEQFRPSTK